MPNINKIKLSGTSYDIQDLNAPKTVTLTQAQYDALVDKDPNTFYIISDASTGDLSQYWTSAQTQSAITQATSGITERIGEDEEVTAAALNTLNDAVSGKVDTTAFTAYSASVETVLSGKQDTLVSSSNIKTINNESLLGSGNIDIQGGGGKAIEAGRGITVTTGETADTVSFNLPISAGTGEISIIIGKHDAGRTSTGKGSYSEGFAKTSSGQYSHAEGWNTYATANYAHAEGCYGRAKGEQSHAEGYDTNASGKTSHVEGTGTQTKNESEHASGHYNNSVSASTTFGDSGNTLFSVGNGTSSSARHNAFEIRQNGDIYLTKDGQDVKLQDQLGGSSITVDTALDSGSTNPVENRVIYNKIDEVEQVTAAGLNALNDNFGGLKLVKLTEAEYNALATKDSSTLYVIVD